jgi:hypothetical protein
MARGAFCPYCGRPVRPQARFCADCGAFLPTAGGLRPGVTLAGGRYTVTRLLGRGGAGACYIVEDARLGRACVVKELHVAGSVAERRRAEADFAREARILAQCSADHPGLPQTYDFFTEQGRHYLVMQYVAGQDLEARLQGAGALPEPEVVGYGAAVAETLAFLHTRRPEPVIHRDVKPANLIVDAQGRVKLVDFGLAKALPSTTSALRAGPAGETGAAGTAGYTPLEQWALHPEPGSDVFALAATLHHLLTGRDPRVPFHGQGELNLDLIRRLTVFPPLRGLRADCAPALDRLITAMLAPDPARRPPAAEVAATLAGLLKPGRSRVSARPAPAPAAAPAILAPPLMRRDALAAALAGWFRANIAGLPAGEPITLRDARAELLPVALGAYHVLARFTEPSGREIHAVDSRGVCLFDGATGRRLDAPVAEAVAAGRGDLASLTPPLPDVSVAPFALDARALRDVMLAALTAGYTTRVPYRAANGRAYSRLCKPTRKQVTFEGGGPLLLHYPLWRVEVVIRGAVYPLTAFQGASGAGVCVVGDNPAGRQFCEVCGRLQTPAQMVPCAACGRRICAGCALHRSRLGIFHKQFCSPACAEAFAASGSVLNWM